MPPVPQRVSLFKRGKTYSVLYYAADGKRHWRSLGVSTKPEALKQLTEFRTLLSKRVRLVSLATFTQDFLTYAEATYLPGTAALYRYTLTRFQSTAGDISLTAVTAEHFDRYRARRLREKTEVRRNPKPRSVSTVNMELRTLRAAFSTARRWGLIDRNPFTDWTLCPVAERTPSFFTRQDFERLVGLICERWLREVTLFAVLTGMRRGEILHLQWDHVNAGQRLAIIESGPMFKTKGGRRRVVPLNETAVYLLEARRNLSPSEYVFTLDDRRIDEDWVTHRFKKYVREAGLPGRLHFHSLRHTFASWLVQSGATLYEVQRLLGHSSPRVTEIYSHLLPEHLHKTVNRIELPLN